MESGVLFIAYVTHSRLASNAVVSSLFDRISTCRIARPSLDALSGTNVFLPGTGTFFLITTVTEVEFNLAKKKDEFDLRLKCAFSQRGA